MTPRNTKIIAVIGLGDCAADSKHYRVAIEVGAQVAACGCVLVTGGLGGVMEAASRGASEAGGLVVGILPGALVRDANAFVAVPIATGIGEARNAVIVNTTDALIAVGGGYGTLSEIAFALKQGKPIVHLGSWGLDGQVPEAKSPEEAVRRVM